MSGEKKLFLATYYAGPTEDTLRYAWITAYEPYGAEALLRRALHGGNTANTIEERPEETPLEGVPESHIMRLDAAPTPTNKRAAQAQAKRLARAGQRRTRR